LQFATLEFCLFFVVVCSAAWALRTHLLARKWLLLIASYVFYAGTNTRLLVLILTSTVLNYVAGEIIERGKKKAGLWLGLTTNLGMLGFFKYYGFFQENVARVMELIGFESILPVLEVVLPLAISYYTFQAIAYVVDLYRGYGVKAKSLLDFALFLAFFPQLLIGPILRSRDFFPQLDKPPEGVPDLSLAASLIFSGLFKKVVLSTFLSTHLVQEAFNAPDHFGSLELLIAAYAYTMQIYVDFSGYTDMARGLGLLLGFQLPDNFNQPYRAENLAEFWRRWHMTFSNWLRDYVFLPMGGSWGPKPKVYWNLMVVMLVTGIWHGAAWKYLVWGGLHGVALIAYKMVQDHRKAKGIKRGDIHFSIPYRLACWLYTFHLVVFLRIFFRSTDLEVAGIYWRQLLSFQPRGEGVEWMILPILGLVLAMNFYGHIWRERFIAWHDRLRSPWRPLAWTTLAIGILLLKPDDVAPYIYFQF